MWPIYTACLMTNWLSTQEKYYLFFRFHLLWVLVKIIIFLHLICSCSLNCTSNAWLNRQSHFTGLCFTVVPRSEKAMATHSRTLAWKIPWIEEPGELQYMGSLRVGHDWVTSLSRTGDGNGNPLQSSCLENPRDGGAWWAAVYGVAQSRTGLKRLSSSSSSS